MSKNFPRAVAIAISLVAAGCQSSLSAQAQQPITQAQQDAGPWTSANYFKFHITDMLERCGFLRTDIPNNPQTSKDKKAKEENDQRRELVLGVIGKSIPLGTRNFQCR